MIRHDALVLSCEHASRGVPRRWSALLPPAVIAAAGHRGVDFGAAGLARLVARELRAPLVLGTATRLLVDLNRSLDNAGLWSVQTRSLPDSERQLILDRYYRPYREAVTTEVGRLVEREHRVLHVSVHSFTPRFAGKVRRVDVGLLHDPARPEEHAIARAWQADLAERLPGLLVRSNQPYRGWTDGMTTHLRRRFGARRYFGIELEINQRHVGTPAWRRISRAVVASLRGLACAGR